MASFLTARFLDRSLLQTVGIAWAIVVPLYVVVWQCYIFPFYVSEMRHVPTVAGFPLWGQFFDIISHEVGEPQRKWHEQYGPIIRYFFPFGAERLSIAEDEALKQMTVKNPYNYPKPVRAKLWMVRILGEGVLLAEGHEHVHQRKALAPGFSIQSIRALTPIFWEKSLLLANCWRKEMHADGVSTKSFEALDWLNRTTLDIIGKAGFGYDVNSLENPDAPLREAYRLCFSFDIVSRILIGLQAFSPIFNHLPSKVNRDLMQSRSIILSKATEIIKEKQEEAANNTGGKDILALIARDNKKLKEAGEAGLSFETMRDQVMTFLGAGHDTTATGVAWTLHLLSKNPVVQSRLREEIKDHMPFLLDKNTRFDANLIAAADADKLPYLDNVCREALRFIPPIPMTVRQSVNDDILGGTVVYVLANAINRLPMYWGDSADEFDPDRWDDLPATATPNAFMTFLQGPRGCIGRKFAETEMKILLCCLLSMYEFQRDFETLDPEDWKMWRLVLRPRDGVTLRVTAI
ncbi:cytochrome P450 monooxygenase fum15 [Colletotrichum spaethianum]|uniref:Cytochrome P450 monooxygenase fum15 n=1 Tax=Colletotrichum spaethianum TaxID=700344 RepID=A0AA37L8K7_9PEZI|nr:cytochrome P450 monooxygenase fum15 [Colletotrichum spaethianum]GKT41658.1 cytochrome P450 monooxygenase fum15 [Colletotrichum spaethianum]